MLLNDIIYIVYPLFISLSFIATIQQHQFHSYPFSKSKNNTPSGDNLGQKLPFKMKFMLYSSDAYMKRCCMFIKPIIPDVFVTINNVCVK